MISKLVSPDQHSERSSARTIKIIRENLFKDLRVVKFQRSFKIFQQILLSGIQHHNLNFQTGIGFSNEIMQTAPNCFQSLKFGMMQDFIELKTYQLINCRNFL